MQADAGHDVPGQPAAATADAVAASMERFLADLAPRAFRFAESALRQREDALDAVQDAMMRMLGYVQRPPAEWTPLFWSILRRRIIDLQRRRIFRLRFMADAMPSRDGDTMIDWTDDGPDPAGSHENRETCTRIAAAVSALPRRQREAFTLRVLEELDVGDTARVMGCSEGSVKTHLSRARNALRQQLESLSERIER